VIVLTYCYYFVVIIANDRYLCSNSTSFISIIIKEEKKWHDNIFLDFHNNISYSFVGDEYSNSTEQTGKTRRPLS
jgi:hypothetical protein